MIHQKKNWGHRTSKIVKSRQSSSNGHLPYYLFILWLSARAHAWRGMWICVRSKDAQKQLARTSLNAWTALHHHDLMTKYVSRRNLRSANGHRLVEVGYKLTRYSSRSFSVASAKLLNALPLDITTIWFNLRTFAPKNFPRTDFFKTWTAGRKW